MKATIRTYDRGPDKKRLTLVVVRSEHGNLVGEWADPWSIPEEIRAEIELEEEVAA